MRNDLPSNHLRPATHFTEYDREVLHKDDLEAFINLSAALTGFSHAELAATGMAVAYFEALCQVVGKKICARFVHSGLEPDALLASALHGPLARNVIRMWYLGQWKRIPSQWLDLEELGADKPEEFDAFGRNTDRVLSAQAYQHGLAWAAMGVNPMGAKQPGFGSWAWPPR